MGTPQELATLRQLATFAESVARRASEFADDVEVLVLRRDTLSYSMTNQTLAPELTLGRLQVGLRALKNGRLAMASTTSFVVDENLAAIRAALPAARPIAREAFSSRALGHFEDGLDDELAGFSRDPASLHALALDIRARTVDAMKTHRHVRTLAGRVSIETRWVAMATRAGQGAFVDNGLSADVEVNSLRGEYERRHAWVDEETLRDVGVRAVRSLPEQRVTPAQLGLAPASVVETVIDPRLVESLIRYPAQDKFLASSLSSGQTSLEQGVRIASDEVTLVDTGALPSLRRPFDDELGEKRDVHLIERGAFGGFVTSHQSARATGVSETGNGFRSPILAEDVSEAPVRDRLSGLSMEPGATPLADLIASTERGIVARMVLGIHGADRARTAFSCTVADGVAIRDGKVAGQLAPGQWNLAGRVLPGDDEAGLLQTARLSSERVDTGSAVLPFLKTTLTV